MTPRGYVGWISLALAGTASSLTAQNSVYGVQGVGFPVRPLSVHARGLSGGNAVFDPGSAVNPATATAFGGITAHLSAATAFRRYSAYDSTVSGLKETRFPLSMVGARIGETDLSFAVSYGPYLERSFDFRTTSVVVVRAESLIVSDRVSSDGGLADFRAAIGFQVTSRLHVGVAGHLLTGSSKLRVRREFSSGDYRPFAQRSDLTFTGAGVSVGVSALVAPGLQLGAALRSDTRLRTTQEGFPTTSVDLPVTFTAGVRLEPVRRVAWATTVERRSWSSGAADLGPGVTAFDTWDVASGLEIGGYNPVTRTNRLPLRFGVRYATLPFSGRSTQAHELTLGAGSGLAFGTRVAMDLAVERATRSGAGAEERVWQASVGVTIVP
ncbi:MAG TPA: hypothetical protein VF970_12270 [Gemmatimonadales bacterium]